MVWMYRASCALELLEPSNTTACCSHKPVSQIRRIRYLSLWNQIACFSLTTLSIRSYFSSCFHPQIFIEKPALSAEDAVTSSSPSSTTSSSSGSNTNTTTAHSESASSTSVPNSSSKSIIGGTAVTLLGFSILGLALV